MTDWTKYTTEELERLTTLTFQTMKGGEYVDVGAIVLRGHNGSLVTADGHIGGLDRFLNMATANRRVVSFTDTTERDPSQEAMLAELTRRTLRFRKGDQVARDFYGVVYIGRVRKDCTQGDDGVLIDWDARQDPRSDPDYAWMPSFICLATPADIAAYEARIPKAPVFKVGELVMCGGEISKVVPVPEKFCNDAWANERQIVWMEGDPNSPLGWEYRHKLRPATDAETAAYHRAHCQPKAEPVKPVVISNATHAGQWVQWLGRPCKVLSITNLVFTPACGLIAVADEDGCVCHIRPNEAILIDPPTWPQ